MSCAFAADVRATAAGRPPEVWTRHEAIARLRNALAKLSDDEHSMCQVAAERGIFCRGFRRWHDHEFHERWKAIIGQSTHLTRAQMEELANVWQLSEQIRLRVRLACDAQTISHGACRGWDEFSNEALGRFCDEILGRSIVVAENGVESPKEAEIRNQVLTSTRLPRVALARKADRQIKNGFEARRSAP
jgi:hypothetical protein